MIHRKYLGDILYLVLYFLCFFTFIDLYKKCFTQIYRALYGDAMVEFIRMSSNMADGNQQKHLLLTLLQKHEFTPRGTHKH